MSFCVFLHLLSWPSRKLRPLSCIFALACASARSLIYGEKLLVFLIWTPQLSEGHSHREKWDCFWKALASWQIKPYTEWVSHPPLHLTHSNCPFRKSMYMIGAKTHQTQQGMGYYVLRVTCPNEISALLGGAGALVSISMVCLGLWVRKLSIKLSASANQNAPLVCLFQCQSCWVLNKSGVYWGSSNTFWCVLLV